MQTDRLRKKIFLKIASRNQIRSELKLKFSSVPSIAYRNRRKIKLKKSARFVFLKNPTKKEGTTLAKDKIYFQLKSNTTKLRLFCEINLIEMKQRRIGNDY